MKAHTMVKSSMWELQSDVLKATLATDAVIGAMVSDFNLSYKLELRIGIQRNELDSRKRYSDFQFFSCRQVFIHLAVDMCYCTM